MMTEHWQVSLWAVSWTDNWCLSNRRWVNTCSAFIKWVIPNVRCHMSPMSVSYIINPSLPLNCFYIYIPKIIYFFSWTNSLKCHVPRRLCASSITSLSYKSQKYNLQSGCNHSKERCRLRAFHINPWLSIETSVPLCSDCIHPHHWKSVQWPIGVNRPHSLFRYSWPIRENP